jgi:hypothetical protein
LLSAVYHIHDNLELKIDCLKIPYFFHICAIFALYDSFHKTAEYDDEVPFPMMPLMSCPKEI